MAEFLVRNWGGSSVLGGKISCSFIQTNKTFLNLPLSPFTLLPPLHCLSFCLDFPLEMSVVILHSRMLREEGCRISLCDQLDS